MRSMIVKTIRSTWRK